MEASVANSTARRFNTGSAPGIPRQTGQTLVLGGAPNLVEQPQKIFVSVSSCTWTSSPMTASYFSFTEGGIWAVAVIAFDYRKSALGLWPLAIGKTKPTTEARRHGEKQELMGG